MPFATEATDFLQSRGVQDLWGTIKRGWAPIEDVLGGMGQAGARQIGLYTSILDDGAKIAAQKLGDETVVPVEHWARNLSEDKRKAAFRLYHEINGISGWAYPDDMAKYGSDPDVLSMFPVFEKSLAIADAESKAVRDPLGNGLKTRDPFTGDWEDYQGIQKGYLPHNVLSEKRQAILDPMQWAQAQIENRVADDYRAANDFGPQGILPPEMAANARDLAELTLHEYLRTGTPGKYMTPAILKEMQPAYETFQELNTHMRRLAVNWANKTGGEIPEEVDPILRLFGSDDPDMQRAGVKMLTGALFRDAENARRMGSIESRRALPLPRSWYEDDPLKILPTYFIRHARRLAEVQHLGQNSEEILAPKTGLLDQMASEYDRAYARKVYDRFMGLEPYNKSLKVNNWMDWVFASQALKLGTAQISQIGQLMNVIMETGLGPTVKGIFNPQLSRDVALKSGATLTRVMDLVREGLADSNATSTPRRFVEGFLKYTGFSKADLIARHVGAGAGWVHGEEMLSRLVKNPTDPVALRELRRLIPGADRGIAAWRSFLDRVNQVRTVTGGRVAPEDIEKYFKQDLLDIARTVSLNSNFRNSILDLPLWASSPLGKLISTFRTFAYRQTVYTAKRAMADFRNGNPRPLIALATAAGVLGPLVQGLKAIPRGQAGQEAQDYIDIGTEEEPMRISKKAFLKGLENISTVGALGLFDQGVRAMRRGETGWFEFIAGPLFSDLANLFGGTGHVVAGMTGLARPEQVKQGMGELGTFAALHVPVVGGGLRRAGMAVAEPVERHPSGVVTRGRTQVLGQEEPPLEVAGYTLPPAGVLLGTQRSVYAQRGEYLDQIKQAIISGDREELTRILREARARGVRISPDSVNRLLREQRQAQAPA